MSIEQKAHSDIGASSLYRWSKCPGSVRVSKDCPKEQTNKYALEGSIAHEGGEKRIKTGSFPPEWSSGRFLTEYPDMLDAVMEYVDLVERERDTDSSPQDVFLLEHRFHLKSIDEEAFGTADCVIYKHNTRTLKVIDYKHGKGHVVDVKNNPQLYYYALGAVLSLPQIKPLKIESIICQPRAFHGDGTTRRQEYGIMELLEFAGDLKGFIEETKNPNAAIVPGDWCHFCPGARTNRCPILQQKALEAAKNEFKPVNAEMPTMTLEAALEIVDAVEAWAKSVREYAYSEAEAGRCPKGYKLVAKVARRQWADPLKTTTQIQRQFLPAVANECFTVPELKSVAQVEKIMGKKDFAQLAEHVVAVSSGTTLVEVSDKRPAIVPGSEFTKVPMTKQDLLS